MKKNWKKTCSMDCTEEKNIAIKVNLYHYNFSINVTDISTLRALKYISIPHISKDSQIFFWMGIEKKKNGMKHLTHSIKICNICNTFQIYMIISD
ncbi:Hypothetical protein SRAE_0000028300 [Strongyloides ratti]|uniref:Uncharacterized protein n=1 Tax=Strongyloides ratti TaxID=34506 RepID=A0A090KUH9_STRRB|nr:Hypothetical protein SRAE_0000028300 [Strongyloides ratti]CEF61155.1 Hypothetical protein SRAE_0000028300 [Strongyloides ratti]